MAMGVNSGRRGGRGGGGRRAPMAEINVTPLVDVMLVLLIIFMVTAPLLVTGVPIKLPESRARALDQDQKPTVLSLDRDGNVFINDEAVPPAQFEERLTALRESLGPTDQLFLRADATLDYGQVMRVMGELNRAGLDRVALVTTGPGAETEPSIDRSSVEP
ncbi:MAG: ExbD/TolR family protein [Sphingomonadales bacterium]|nr:ExbD/TolR family protein [Sphingomonadales bacterium]